MQIGKKLKPIKLFSTIQGRIVVLYGLLFLIAFIFINLAVSQLTGSFLTTSRIDSQSQEVESIATHLAPAPASGDAEGTLGGLVRQGRPDAFPRILRKAIANARTCSNDPVCIMSRGQGRDSLNLAACHACGLLPETCCEERNAFLDRGVIVGTYESPEIGFWNDID